MTYGYYSENQCAHFIAERFGMTETHKPDDHLKTKADVVLDW
jgi:hypothetical protein